MTTTPPYTADRARQDYPLKIRRAGLIEMGLRFGFTESTLRDLIEGESATLKSRKYGNQKRGYFDRDEALRTFADA